MLLNYDFAVQDPLAAAAALAQAVDAEPTLALSLAKHLESSVHGFGRRQHGTAAAVSMATRDYLGSITDEHPTKRSILYQRIGHKVREGRNRNRPTNEPNEERSRRLITTIDAAPTHRYEKLAEMPW